MLVDEKQERRLGTSQEESKIFIYFILKPLDLFIEEILFSVFAGAVFLLQSKKEGHNIFFDEKVQRFIFCSPPGRFQVFSPAFSSTSMRI